MKSILRSAASWIGAGCLATQLLPAGACAAPPRAASAPDGRMIGHYVYSAMDEAHGGTQLTLDVTRGADGKLAVAYTGTRGHNPGVAPEGSGSGSVDAKGVLHFDYEDSFGNKGAGSIRSVPHGCRLVIDIKQVMETRCLPFYGEHFLERQQRSTP